MWRRFLLSSSATFFDLHEAIQLACGWTNSHLFHFCANERGAVVAGIPDDEGWDDVEVPDARDVKLAAWFGAGRTTIEYEYDFGDAWVHNVKLLGTVEHEEKHKRKLLDGARAFPPEDCGGLDGYRRCVALVKPTKNPRRDNHDDDGDGDGDNDDDDLRRWLGRWDPERFNIDAVRRKFDSKPAKAPSFVTSPRSPTPKPARERNAWCVALDVDVPDVAEVASRKTPYGPVRLADLVVVALVEQGAPMTEADVVAHLAAAGVSTGTGDLEKSLKRSLASTQAPILRDHEGRLTLDLKSQALAG